jgi:hypothetical protein
MSVLDLALVLVVATAAALGATRRIVGLVVGVGGALLLRPLLLLADVNPWLAIGGAVVVGVGLAVVARQLLQVWSAHGPLGSLLGGAGGALLGVALVLTLVTSLPIGRSPLNPNELVYPPDSLPVALRPSAQRSLLVGVGREVLFAPLLEDLGVLPASRAAVVLTLHRWVVVGEPWRAP